MTQLCLENEAEIKYPNYHRGGGFGAVFQLSPNVCGKIIYVGKTKRNLAIKRLSGELDILKVLYEGNVAVPKPFGVYDVDFNLDESDNPIRPALVMEFFNGVRAGSTYNPRLSDRIQKRARIELEKARKLGICEGSDWNNGNNVLYNPESDRICLVDFGLWSKGQLRRSPSRCGRSILDYVFRDKFKIESLNSDLLEKFEMELRNDGGEK